MPEIPVGRRATLPLGPGRRVAPDLPTTPGRRVGDLPTAGADWITLVSKGGGWFSFITPDGYFIVSQKGSAQDPRYDIAYYDVSEKMLQRGLSAEELLDYEEKLPTYSVVTTALGPPKQPDMATVKRSLPKKGVWAKLKGIFSALTGAGKKEHVEHIRECLINSGITLSEERKMKSSDIVKKDLLRRKIREHFTKNPKVKSVVVKADIGDRKTIWRAQKMANGLFNVVEVNTTREQFLITEITGTPSPQYRKFTTEFVGAAANPADRAAQSRLSQAVNSLPPGPERQEAEAAMQSIGMKMQTTGQLGKQMGGIGRASRTSTLTMGKKAAGAQVAEADEDKPKKKEEPKKKKPDKPDAPKASPPSSDTPPGAEMATDTSAPGGTETEPVDRPETDLDVTPPEGDAGAPPPEEEKPGAKTAEEERLRTMVKNRPIQDIEISSESDKGTITLTVGGLKNPVEISVFDSGKITYNLGKLPFLLKPGA